MIPQFQTDEECMDVVCRICEKTVQATLISAHLVTCQAVFETKKQLNCLETTITNLGEQAQQIHRSLLTQFSISKNKHSHTSTPMKKGMYKSQNMNGNRRGSLGVEKSITQNSEISQLKNQGKSQFSKYVIQVNSSSDEASPMREIIKLDISPERIEQIYTTQIQKSNSLVKCKSPLGPTEILSQRSLSPAMETNNDFQAELQAEQQELLDQLKIIKIITKYCIEANKASNREVLLVDLKTQIELSDIKDCPDIKYNILELIKQTLNIVDERIQANQKLNKLNKVLTEQVDVTPSNRKKRSVCHSGWVDITPAQPQPSQFAKRPSQLDGMTDSGKWLQKPKPNTSHENSMGFKQCESGSSTPASSSGSLSQIDKSFEVEPQSTAIEELETSKLQFKSKMVSQKHIKIINQVPESITVSQDHRGYFSDGDLKTTRRIGKQEQILKVQLQDFEFIQVLGIGAFGAVWLVRKRLTKDYYAMKVIDCKNKNMKEFQDLRAEKNVFELLEGDFVVKAFYSFIQDGYLFFLLEYMKGGDFGTVLSIYCALDEAIARFYLAELLLAIESLHKKGIIHRDLKPQNILLDANGHIKLADFGLSEIDLAKKLQRQNSWAVNCSIDPDRLPEAVTKTTKTLTNIEFMIKKPMDQINGSDQKVNSQKKQHRIVGTPDYIPPEVISGSCVTNLSVDWWSFGVIMYEFLVGIPPFNDESIPDIFQNILNNKIEWPEVGFEDDQLSPDAFDLIKCLLNPIHKLRLGSKGAWQIKKHPFFKNIDWHNIRTQEAPIIPIRDLDSLCEEEADLTKKRNEEMKMKSLLSKVHESQQDMCNMNEIANLTRLDLLAELSQQDADTLMKKRSGRLIKRD